MQELRKYAKDRELAFLLIDEGAFESDYWSALDEIRSSRKFLDPLIKSLLDY